jgi:hypothetical protein
MRGRAFVIVLGLVLLAIDPRWLPEFGIDPRVAVNAALLVGLAVIHLNNVQDRFTPI